MRGLAKGGYNSCIYLGMMASSAIMGGIIRGVGFAGGFLGTSLVTALVTGGYFLMARRDEHENLG